MPCFEQSISRGKGVVEDRVVGEVAHGKVVDPLDGACMPLPLPVDAFNRQLAHEHASSLTARVKDPNRSNSGSHPNGQIRQVHAAIGRARRTTMRRLLLQWLLSALALLITAKLVPGFIVAGIGAALIAAAIIGLLNATIGLVLKILTFPLSILTLGLFLLVINGLMILAASAVVPGFRVYGLIPAFWGAVVLALLGMLFRALVKDAAD